MSVGHNDNTLNNHLRGQQIITFAANKPTAIPDPVVARPRAEVSQF